MEYCLLGSLVAYTNVTLYKTRVRKSANQTLSKQALRHQSRTLKSEPLYIIGVFVFFYSQFSLFASNSYFRKWRRIRQPVHTFRPPQLSALYGPGHAKTCLMQYANNKSADQPVRPRSLIGTFVVRCLDSMRCILAISKASRF